MSSTDTEELTGLREYFAKGPDQDPIHVLDVIPDYDLPPNMWEEMEGWLKHDV